MGHYDSPSCTSVIWYLFFAKSPRSTFPSPFTSATPAICQFKSPTCAITALPAIVRPFMSHPTTSPVWVLYHTRSPLASPLRSPTPAICHTRGTPVETTPACLVVRPSISHPTTSPVWVLRHTRSAFPSPSTSVRVCAEKEAGGGG